MDLDLVLMLRSGSRLTVCLQLQIEIESESILQDWCLAINQWIGAWINNVYAAVRLRSSALTQRKIIERGQLSLELISTRGRHDGV